MNRTTLAAVLLACTALATPASAVNFTLSDINGVPDQTFGSITGAFLANGTTAEFTISIPSPPFLIDNGSHFLLSLSLLGAGRIDASTIAALNPTLSGIVVANHLTTAAYQNGSFKYWTDGIEANCGNGGSSGGCGHSFVFDVLNWAGAGFATNQFEMQNVVAAVDIQYAEHKTGIVGAAGTLTPTPFAAVPGPVVGAGIPGLVAACMTMLGFNYRRRRRNGGTLPA